MNKLFFFIAIILLLGCASPKAFVFRGIHSVKIEKASFGKNTFKAQLQYENPNKFQLTLKKLDCEVFIDDQPFTTYSLDTNYIIPANAVFNLPATMQIELASILKNGVDILFNKPLKITVKGNATLSKGFITKVVPIEFTTEQKLNLKQLMSATK